MSPRFDLYEVIKLMNNLIKNFEPLYNSKLFIGFETGNIFFGLTMEVTYRKPRLKSLNMDETASRMKVNAGIGIYNDIEPSIKNLCNDLTQLVSINTAKASGTFQNIRKAYIDVSILLKLLSYCLSDAIEASHNSSEDKKLDSLNKIFEALSCAELLSYKIPSNEEHSLHLLGVETDTFYKTIEILMVPKNQQLIHSIFQTYLVNHCSRIIDFASFDCDCSSVSQGMQKVLDEVINTNKDLHLKRVLVLHQQRQNRKLLSMVFQHLSDYSDQLEKLISDYRFLDHPLMLLQLKSVSMETCVLKLRCIELNVQNTIYNNSTVPALKLIDKKLDNKREKFQNSLFEVNQKLSSYLGVDSNFQNLLVTYKNLQQEIDFFEKVNAKFNSQI